jgi:endonuclease/exonuclease/phosphatase family metal-dependent hydrolase
MPGLRMIESDGTRNAPEKRSRVQARWLPVPFLLIALSAPIAVPGAVPRGTTAPGDASRGAAESKPPTSPARLRLATWNVAWLNRSPGEGRVPRHEEDYARLRRLAEGLGADVVALQEIDGPEAARRLFDASSWDLQVTGDPANPQRIGFAIRRGIPVTRHPDLVDLAGPGRRRGADLTVHLRGGDLRLLAVHLKSGCQTASLTSGREECTVLARQLAALERWIDERAREGGAFAVLGDFNRRFDPPDRFWAEIDDADPPGADLTAVTEGKRPACWGGRYSGFIDHIVLGRSAAAWIVPHSFESIDYDPADRPHEAVLSDHCPLVVELDSLRAAPLPPRIGAAEARGRAGEIATVCGRVAGTKYVRSLRGSPTFLDLDRKHPDAPLVVVIWGDDRAAFGEPETRFAGRRICVTGLIRLHQGRPEIVVRRPAEISVESDPVDPGGGPAVSGP